MEMTLSDVIADYIEQRKQAKLEPLKKRLNKALAQTDEPVKISQAKAEYQEQASPIEAMFAPQVWLTDAAKRAKQISLATHAAKFSHSDAKATSILLTHEQQENYAYVTTACLTERAIDAVGNAAALDVAKLLKLSVNGESLVTQLQAGHVNALTGFTQESALLAQWQNGFIHALGDSVLAAHTLVKQVYYPIAAQSQEYHLLCPLFSSSLAQKLHHTITKARFGDEVKAIREAKKQGLYHSEPLDIFPNTAIQTFGGSKPQNISQLNSERYGKCFLLDCAPPTYQRQVKPPLTSRSIFNSEFSYSAASLINEFKAFLIGLDASDRNFHIRYQRDYGFVMPLLDRLFDYVASVQNLTEFAAWSSQDECQMKRSHRLWLDPYNPESQFQLEREKGDWQAEVAHDFASWLLHKLKSTEHYQLGDIEHRYFKKLCLHQLKAFERATPKLGEN